MRNAERDRSIVESYKELTMREIGEIHGITGERVRQVLSKAGVSFEGSERQKYLKEQSKLKDLMRMQEADDRFLERYGVRKSEIKPTLKARLGEVCYAYRQMKRNAIRLGVDHTLTLKDFWDIWRKSRKFNRRGAHPEYYSLTRIDFKKGYVLGNVQIEKNTDFYIRIGKHSRKWRMKLIN